MSADALVLSKENATLNQVAISFVQSDVFENISGSFDIIVSNPPYISENDKDEVGINVLASEPKMALFADEEGLAIYRQIIEEADRYLTPSGKHDTLRPPVLPVCSTCPESHRMSVHYSL